MDAIWTDLLQWQKEINKKDATLSKRRPVHDTALPPVRKSTEIILDNLKPEGLNILSAEKKTGATTNTRAEKAEAEKAKGNTCFAKKDYKNAIMYYSKAIDLDPTIPVYFVNRAMAHLKTNNFLEAEKDCSRGIQLQPGNVKALWRRGIALRELGRPEEARRDFEAGLKIEPNNKSILDELKKLPPPSKAAAKPVKQQQQKSDPIEKKRRLPINVIDDAYTKSSKAETLIQPKPVEPKIAQVKESAKAEKTPQPTAKDPKITQVKKPAEPKEAKTPVQTPAPPKQTNLENQSKPSPAVVTSAMPLKFICPRTNFEFERDWKTYKGRGDDVLYQYFQSIPPKQYATIFKSSLESDQFEKMIDMLESRYTAEKSPEDIFYVLEGLSSVKRIDMLVMFLDRKRQQSLQALFNQLKTSDKVPQDQLTKLAKIYGVRM